MIYDQLEDAIVDRLEPVKTALGIDVVALPENQAQFIKPFEKARVTVNWNLSAFNGGRYGSTIPTKTLDASAQQEDIEIKLLIQSRKLRGESGTYVIIDAIRRRLLGFRPLLLDPLKLTETKYEEFHENLWMHSMTFSTKAISIEDVPASTDPLLVDISLDQNFPVSL